MVAYPGDGTGCAGTLSRAAHLPVFQARPFDAARLLGAQTRNARLTTHPQIEYVYDLAGAWSGPGAGRRGARRHHPPSGRVRRADRLARRHQRRGPPRLGDADRLGAGRDVAAYGLVRPVAVPSTVTHYVSPIAEWERTVEIQDADGRPEGMLFAPRKPVRAGQTLRDRWFAGPIATNQSPLLEGYDDWRAYAYREGDYLWMVMSSLADAAGHVGAPIYLEEFEGRFFQDGELVAEGDEPLRMQYFAPAEPHAYRLVYTTHRDNGFWRRSTTTETAWEFSSGRPSGDHEVLPLLAIDYDLPLSELGTARAGAPLDIGLRFRMPPEVATAPLARVGAEVSWDRGATWAPAELSGCADGGAPVKTKPKAAGCTVRVTNRQSGSASLRITAADTAGRTVSQTVIDAYAVR
jgi:hypothetical protein